MRLRPWLLPAGSATAAPSGTHACCECWRLARYRRTPPSASTRCAPRSPLGRISGYVGTWRLYCRYPQERGRLAVPGPCQRPLRAEGTASSALSGIAWHRAGHRYLRQLGVDRLLSRVLEPDQEPSAITRQSLDEFFRRRGRSLPGGRCHHTVQVVRRYLRYAFDTGVLIKPLT